MAQEYLQHAITLKSINTDIMCEFLSSDRIHNLSNVKIKLKFVLYENVYLYINIIRVLELKKVI